MIKSESYKWDMDNIQIGIDDTDHIVFICPHCFKPLKVINLETIKGEYSRDEEGKWIKENCSWIYLGCDSCKRGGQRKFYWESEDGLFCRYRTYKKENKE